MNCGNDTENDMFGNYVSDDNMQNIDNPEYTELQNVVNSIFTISPCKTSSVNQPVNGIVLEPSYDETIYLSLKEKSEVKDLLEEWKMGYLLQTCVAECVDVEALKYINSKQIAQLLHKYPLGKRIKFEHYVKQWRKNSIHKDVRNESTSRKRSISISSISSTSSPSTSSEPIQSFLLHDILTKSVQGALITDYYRTNKNLNETCRNLLVDLIVSSLIDKQMSMSICLADRIATEIIGTFTTELKEVYFIRDLTNKCPKGKLYSKYFNKIRSLRSHGLVSQLPKDNKNVEKQTRVCAELDSEIIEDDAEVATLLSSLKHEDLSWPDIEVIWKKTTGYRLQHLKATHFSAVDIQKTWPQYTKPLGYKLIDIDFKRLYGKNVSDLLTTFDASYNKLFQIYNERIKDVNSKKLLEELKNDINASESSKHCVIIYLMHALFLPTSKKSSIDSDGKKCLIKFSIKDSQNSFIMVSNTAIGMEEMLKLRKSNNNPIQPCLLIVGTILNPTQILVYFDDVKYKFFSIIKALDICFKIFHVFNIEYPLESQNVWLFIQRYFYDVKLKFDKPCPLVYQIISELK
ncbi:uncharacterized protein LOC107882231 isoform X2 [Acyrthosiphon pisum]|uniref:Uncharacterized protein n=1 Tax=Acyrthosiphon pisum TaxID=7029 RepID=A0A8R2JW32_ACYPI|nr:uncharacterized protein LOC107882231 isoform X2 [Acyrthosiphon pisum]